mmetsp:Transcript_20786/g.57712  ORF Transcript_20786/g.57712 Transcript_20786/m.57712 type:complete len:354 (-) Transcript_20786:295-1356(-)
MALAAAAALDRVAVHAAGVPGAGTVTPGDTAEWGQPAFTVLPGTLWANLRHGRTAYVLMDDSPVSHDDNEKDERPVVVLIHGLGLWSFVWQKLANALFATGRCKAVLMYDRYGRGASDVATDGNSGEAVRHTPDLFAQQLDDLLVNVQLRSGKMLKKEGRLVVVGASMGGLIATKFAAVSAPLVQRLVLIAPAGLQSPPAMASFNTQLLKVWGIGHAAFAVGGHGMLLKMIKGQKFRDDAPDLPTTDPQLLAELTEASVWQVNSKPGFLWDFYRDITQIPWQGMQREADTIGGHSYDVQLVWGTEDECVPTSHADLWQQRIPRARLTKIDKAAHSPHLTDNNFANLVPTILPP